MSIEQDPQADPRPLSSGTVTRLVAQQHDPNRVSVFIDGHFAFGIHVDVLVEYLVQKGQNLSVEAQQKLIHADQVRRAYNTALAYLGYRARTEREVRQKLARKGFGEPVAEEVVIRLTKLEYLDDAAYATSYVTSRFRSRGYGPQRLRTELARRGVASSIIASALEKHLDDEDTLEAARRHARKRWPRVVGEDDPYKRRQKLSAYLVRRGFSFDTARQVIGELEQDAVSEGEERR